MWENNRVTKLLGTKYPIIQAGMIWSSGWELAAAVANAGGLGVLGSGSMYPHILEEQLTKLEAHTDKSFAVNLPLFYPDIPAHVETIIRHKVKYVITSAGNPATYTQRFKDQGIRVLHLVASQRFAEKAQKAGCDAVVAEGMEAGGHIGHEENTTFVLVPLVRKTVDIPVIAAGGIATGRQMLAAMILGADGVQVGSRFVASDEASSHINYKNAVVNSKDGDTVLTLKELIPVRMLKNDFYQKVSEAYGHYATRDELAALLGRARPKRGMFEGNLADGELQIGQVASLINDIRPAAQIIEGLVAGFKEGLEEMQTWT